MDRYSAFIKDYSHGAQEMKRLIDDYSNQAINNQDFENILVNWMSNFPDKFFIDKKHKTFPPIAVRILGKRRISFLLSVLATKKIS